MPTSTDTTRARLSIDPARPETWPPLMRVSDICRDPKRGYPGILPVTRSGFLTMVEDGYVEPPIRLGNKVVAWRREAIVEIVKHGVKGRRPRGRNALAGVGLRPAQPEIPAAGRRRDRHENSTHPDLID